MNDKISVIIPTYNERDNIPELVERLDKSLKGYKYEIIVLDDDSPEDPWKVAQELSKKYPVRTKSSIGEKGLSTAVIRGIQESNDGIIVIIDADLQHPPEKVPELVEAIKTGADIAIGSRFVEGGGIKDWSRKRLIVSKGAKFLAETLFRDLREIKDVESGFFAFKKNILENVQLEPVGYKILLEILVMADCNKVTEVPFVFENRKRGKSKLGFKNISNYLHHLLSLAWRTKEIHRFIKFCIIGGIGGIINIAILYSLTESGVYYLISGAIAIESGLLSNFVFNKVWTFKDMDVKGSRAILKALCKDHIVRSGGIILNLSILWFLTSVVGVYYILSQLIGIGVAMIWNFGGNKWFTWE
jgi:dolichol-phosphate mannosyltransferase